MPRFITQSLGALTLVVRDYDEAIAFFVGTLGFDLLEDTRLDATKRWVRVRPRGSSRASATSLVLARATTPEQRLRIGDQTGGRVFLFLETDDCWRDYERWRSAVCVSWKLHVTSRTARWWSSRISTETAGISSSLAAPASGAPRAPRLAPPDPRMQPTRIVRERSSRRGLVRGPSGSTKGAG